MRYALGVEYQGWPYRGFQRQAGQATVQGELERCLTAICAQPVEVTCAGRTDAGVSATGQVIHLDIDRERSGDNLMLGCNTLLPPDIAITWAQAVPGNFHARFSALSRRYRYLIYNARGRPAVMGRGLTVCHGHYDVELMDECAQQLLGEHDFSSFCSADEQSRTRRRCVQQVQVRRCGDYIVLDISANAFLNRMVRNIMGTLLLVGCGRRSPAWFEGVLTARSRPAAGPAAPPGGLYLVSVIYPGEFDLPQRLFLGPLWLP